MGAWGTAIFSNDTSSDVRGDFREMIEDGLSAEEATAKLLAAWGHAANDPDDRASFWTGLAATQCRLGRLLPEVREKAIEIIDAGGDLHLWAETGSTERRKTALQKLRAQLLGPQRDPVKVRPPTKIFSPVQAGQTVEWTLPDGRATYLKVLSVKAWRQGSYPILEIVDARGRTLMQKQAGIPGSRTLPRQPARYAIIEGRRKHLPKPEDFRVVAVGRAKRIGEPTSYTGWHGLGIICQRLIDDPGSRPTKGWRSLFGS